MFDLKTDKIIFFTHLKLFLAIAAHNFKLVNKLGYLI